MGSFGPWDLLRTARFAFSSALKYSNDWPTAECRCRFSYESISTTDWKNTGIYTLTVTPTALSTFLFVYANSV